MKSLRLSKDMVIKSCQRSFALTNDSKSAIISDLLSIIQSQFEQYHKLFEGYPDSDMTPTLESEFFEVEELVSKARCHLLSLEAIDNKSSNPESNVSNEALHKTVTDLLAQQSRALNIIANRPEQRNNQAITTLPKLQISKFSGAYEEWSSFRDIYESSIHTNASLDNIQKFQHLKSLLIGDAESIIKSIPITAANYEIAWRRVIDRYNHPYFIIRSLIENLDSCNQVSQNCGGLRKLTNTLIETIQCLDNLNEYSKGRDPWVLHTVLSKLDEDSKQAWADENSCESAPTVENLVEFLENRCLASEMAKCGRSNSKYERSQESRTQKLHDSHNKRSHSLRLNTTLSAQNCLCCSQNHMIFRCAKFNSLSVSDREALIKSQSRCFNCFNKGHSVKTCKSSYACSKCKRRHHSLLHRSESSQTVDAPNLPENTNSDFSSPQSTSESILQFNLIGKCSSALLPTVLVETTNIFGKTIQIRALLDSGSQSNFISEKMFRMLGFPRNQVKVPISSFSSDQCLYSKGQTSFIIQSRRSPEHKVSINAHILPKMIDNYPGNDLAVSHLDELVQKCPLADPYFYISSSVDLILNGAIFLEALKPGRYKQLADRLIIHNTIFGHIVCSHDETSHGLVFSNNLLLDSSEESGDRLLEKFWALEEPPRVNQPASSEDTRCEIFYKNTTTRLSSGRFCVQLPFSSPPCFGDSYHNALRRFFSLERKFKVLPDFKNEYVKFMSDYALLGHMTHLQCSIDQLKTYNHFIIPHHGIWQSGISSKRKLRVVFDASSKSTNGMSLNDHLHSGPALQAELPSIILKFRLFRYVMSTDIEKMYRQILVNECDQLYQLILWRENVLDPIKIYKLNTVTYGESCSPFLAIRTLQELAFLGKSCYPNAYEILMKGTYVDDIFFGENNMERIEKIRNELIQLMQRGGFQLRKWASNEPLLLKDFPQSDLANPLLFTDDSNSSIKMLGLIWSPKDDYFSYQVNRIPIENNTKRCLLSHTARLFDPMGWISPIVLQLKLIFQETWIRKVGWDAPLPRDLHETWLAIHEQLSSLQNLRLPRWIPTTRFEIHGFADASEKAYSAMIYSRSVSDGVVSVNLLIAKSKLAPIKQISIPRLELCAAHLLARLVSYVTKFLSNHITEVSLWSDSATVLAWLHSMPRKWSTFVGNRITHILELCPDHKWYHVPTKSNPADIGSRGCSVVDLINSSLWWHGPNFLHSREFTPSHCSNFSTNEESTNRKLLNVLLETPFWISFTERFSSFNRMIHTAAYLFRIKDRLHPNLKITQAGPLTANETRAALHFLLLKLQEHYYAAEIFALKNTTPISSSSSLISFTPFLDEGGLLRVGGRLGQAELKGFNSHPIILPLCHMSRLFVIKLHHDNFHGNFSLILSQVRQNFWIPGVRRVIQSTIRKCSQCIRYNAQTKSPLMGDLPTYRTQPTKPFLKTGVDFAGPFSIRPWRSRGNLTMKSYIAVFVCVSTKAIHLELIMSLDVSSLIMAINRFLARRGRCEQFLSDNGRNFIGAGRLFKEYRSAVQSTVSNVDLKSFLSNLFIEWKYIPAYSPNFGGLWEAGVKSVKRHLFHAFHNKVITVEELSTVLCQVENIVNSRPLLPISLTSPDVPLTPNLLLVQASSALPLQLHHSKVKLTNPNVLQSVQYFWNRWRTEYLDTLIKRSKWKQGERNLAIDDLVLIKRKADPPNLWLMGRIVRVFPGIDQIVRVVSVKTKSGTRTESCRNLIPLIVSESSSTRGAMNNASIEATVLK